MTYLIIVLIIASTLLVWCLHRVTKLEDQLHNDIVKLYDKYSYHSDIMDYYSDCLVSFRDDLDKIKKELNRDMP